MSELVQRTVFATPRAAEFLEERTLQAQTGQPVDAFGSVVIKELIDNALDAAESAGRAPIINIITRAENGITFVTVTDNGSGITSATIAKIIDFSVLASDKARYRGPSRGAQGNALKTLLGIPFALGVAEPVIIESCGVRHELRVSADPAGDVHVAHDTAVSGQKVGTSVSVPLPDYLEIDAGGWAFNTALVNPHATITVDNPPNSDTDRGAEFYKPSDHGWSKWTPAMPSSPHWYDKGAFTALVYSQIREIKTTGVDVPLGGFITEFDGLKGSVKQKAIRTVAAAITHLSGLEGRDDTINALHDAMLTHAKPTPAGKLGAVGKDHFERLLDDWYGVRRCWYKASTVTDDGVPYVVEVAVADTEASGGVWFGCNHSPAFGDPLGRTRLSAADIYVTGAASFLSQSGVDQDHRAAVVHVICAAPQFVDKGKVALVAPVTVADAAARTLESATKVIRREDEQRRKDAAKADRAEQRARDEARRAERQMSLKDAVFRVMPEAKAAAGHVVDVRTLFYQVRPRIQQFTNAEFNYDYFTQTLVPEYERTVSPLEGLYYEARGELHHPHDGQVIKLGTREVEAYIPPEWQFNKVLYIEKSGLAAQLAPYELSQRYDMAIIHGKGYAAKACRELLAIFSEIHDAEIFVLHDGDLDGYNIARTLAEATRRMPDHHIKVIDLGLTVPQAIEHGLETEGFTRKKALPTDLELDDDAVEWFTGEPFFAGVDKKGRPKTHYACRRCELNAFSADQLVEFIKDGLRRHSATAKVIPPQPIITDRALTVRDDQLTELINDELDRIFGIAGIRDQLISEFPTLADVDHTGIQDSFADAPTLSWRGATRQLVAEHIDADGDGITASIIAQLRATIDNAAAQDGDL
ncbi:hypothetical protein NGTWS0302_24110 [Mycolicibacterium cyprinidarum]|uniref:Topoisomerase 6 subunit A/Spo11 TOPRIM domain-containing protein n=1 Tax=Mycolicibacterium cyprinidarum TaxID=2860311 RepID=A0ABQ4VAU3_9MYCO|nr:hypothetical protein NGTWS0302_24110 [Mycolicibacterium sp. NGTWS0302]GJF17093.1 hypothetical protein NGTWS1702_22990 [Mycolicibacterium sp. NGTWSNA01]